MQSIDTDLVAEIWQQAVKLTKSYLQNELAKAQQPTIEGVHADLARCFMRHQPEAKLISQSSYSVALDVSNTKMWKDRHGEFPADFRKYFTKNGVMEFFANETKGMRKCLFWEADVSDTELQFICDTWVERQWSSVGQWLHDAWCQGEYSSKEAPWLLIQIADLNPLTAVAKIIGAFHGEYLFTGKPITDVQIVEVCIGGVFSVFEVSACFSTAIEKHLNKILGEDQLFQALCLKAFEAFVTRGVAGAAPVWAPN